MWSYYCKPNRNDQGPWMWAIFQPPDPIFSPGGLLNDMWSMSSIKEKKPNEPKVLARMTSLSKRDYLEVVKERIAQKTSEGYIHVLDAETSGCAFYEPLEGGDSPLIPFVQIGAYIHDMAQTAHSLRYNGSLVSTPGWPNFEERTALQAASQGCWDAFCDLLIRKGMVSWEKMKDVSPLALDEIVINFALNNIVGTVQSASWPHGRLLALDAYEFIEDEPCPVW